VYLSATNNMNADTPTVIAARRVSTQRTPSTSERASELRATVIL
jgi:hypothetical protein